MRRSIIVALLVGLSTSAGSPAGQAAEPELEAAIRKKAAEVLLDPYSAVFTLDVVTPINDIGGKSAALSTPRTSSEHIRVASFSSPAT